MKLLKNCIKLKAEDLEVFIKIQAILLQLQIELFCQNIIMHSIKIVQAKFVKLKDIDILIINSREFTSMICFRNKVISIIRKK